YSAAILDGSGRVVAHSGATAPVSPEAVRQHRAPERSSARWDTEGASTLEVVHRSGLSDWIVVTGVERAAFEAPLRRSLAILGGLALVLLCVGGTVAWSYGRRVASAAANLTAAAEAIGRGAPVAVPPAYIREANLIGDALASASRTLAEQRAAIAEAQARLESRVAERTRELEASRAHYRLLAENMTDVVVLRRLGAAPSYVSPSVAGLLGRVGDVRAFEAGRDVHPEDRAAFEAVERRIGPDCPSLVSVFRLRHTDGRWIWIEAVNDFLPTAGPADPNVISTLRDVTLRQHQADELRMARDAAELAQGRAESMNRAKSAFIGLMSHEIRTPLTTIAGFADLLAEGGGLSQEQRRHLGLITAATETLLVGVDDILDFARSESGDLRIEAAPFVLARTVAEVAKLVRPLAAERRIDFVAPEGHDIDGLLLGDERRLRQILLNLLNDTVATARSGTVTLAVRVPRGGEAHGTLRFTITATMHDGGRDNEPLRAVALVGSGLGVTVAERLLGLMGSRIDRATRPGEAVAYRFTLSLPPAPTAMSARREGPSVARSARLLVAEDSPINQEIVCTMLERSGYRVDTVEDGEAALAAVQAQTYDLVLMDVQMPGMDG
ncbi:MAG TPA: histidine kinase dimerization/phospho-acceptor domain-containing protein, partial [Methylobacterium sp.]